MQTTATAGHAPRDTHFTSRLSDRLSHIVAQGWLAEGLIIASVTVMVLSMLR